MDGLGIGVDRWVVVSGIDHMAQGAGEFDAGLFGEFVDLWERTDHAAEEVCGGVPFTVA